jgi:TonB-dependent SusC/RagA subfamily outer membrane receptor
MRYVPFLFFVSLLVGRLPTLAQTHPTLLITDSSVWLDSIQPLSLSQQVVAVQQRAWRDTLLAPYQPPVCRMGQSVAERNAAQARPVFSKPWGLPLLYVVDGQPFYNNDVVTITRLQQALRSHPIKQVTILRDMTAAALYGGRAANGVVVLSSTKAKKHY